MTITRTADGCWELRTRHRTLVATGDLYAVVNAWARLRREGWSDVPRGQPALIDGRRTIECTECHDCQCRACNTIPATGSHT
jgi:hypothetical protein